MRTPMQAQVWATIVGTVADWALVASGLAIGISVRLIGYGRLEQKVNELSDSVARLETKVDEMRVAMAQRGIVTRTGRAS